MEETCPVSHIVEIQTEVRDAHALRAACQRLHLSEPVAGTHELFASQTASGLAVQLPGWRYPLVCEPASGQLRFDNFGGRWKDQT